MTSRWALFCESSSIRGVQKITKAKSIFIKVIWGFFVICMTLILVITSALLIKDFLAYDTAWHTSTAFDDKPGFPSFTLCSHNPFSLEAQKVWDSKRILSPEAFQEQLKKIPTYAMRHRTQMEGREYEVYSAPFYDRAAYYYQNLRVEESVSIGHNYTSLFFCLLVMGGIDVIADHCQTGEIIIKRFSHQDYFNCYTVDIREDIAPDVENLIVVMSLVPAQDIRMLNTSFLFDVLHKGEGVKVTLHEKGVIPDFTQGFNVEPGKMNEIFYETTKWNKFSTPHKECKDQQSTITHLGESFIPNYHQCVKAELQRIMVDKCGCLNGQWPVIEYPGDKITYCMNVTMNVTVDSVIQLAKRFKCAEDVLKKEAEYKLDISYVKCFPRCSYFSYESTLAITKWIPSARKIAAMVGQYDVGNRYFLNLNDDKDVEEYITGISKTISSYATSEFNSLLNRYNTYTYINVKRRNWDAIIKLEKLVLDVNILLSRIGGLCSLCIGLTAAVAVEMIEFVYLNFQYSRRQNAKTHYSDNENQEHSNLLINTTVYKDPWEKTEVTGQFSPTNHESMGLQPISAV